VAWLAPTCQKGFGIETGAQGGKPGRGMRAGFSHACETHATSSRRRLVSRLEKTGRAFAVQTTLPIPRKQSRQTRRLEIPDKAERPLQNCAALFVLVGVLAVVHLAPHAWYEGIAGGLAVVNHAVWVGARWIRVCG
jgi:hypothetical protein